MMKLSNIFVQITFVFLLISCQPIKVNDSNLPPSDLAISIKAGDELTFKYRNFELYNRRDSNSQNFNFIKFISDDSQAVSIGPIHHNMVLVKIDGQDKGWVSIKNIKGIKKKAKPLDNDLYRVIDLNLAVKDSEVSVKNVDYNFFYDQGDYLTKLVENEDFLTAAKLYELEYDYFSDFKSKYSDEIDSIRESIKGKFTKSASICNDMIQDISKKKCNFEWYEYNELKKECHKLLDNYEDYDIVINLYKEEKPLSRLSNSLDNFCNLTERISKSCFASFDHINSEDTFFTNYPCGHNLDEVFRANSAYISDLIKKLSIDELIVFERKYSDQILRNSPIRKNIYGKIYNLILDEISNQDSYVNSFQKVILLLDKVRSLDVPERILAPNSFIKSSNLGPLQIKKYPALIYPKPDHDSYSRVSVQESDEEIFYLGKKVNDMVRVSYNGKKGWLTIYNVESFPKSTTDKAINAIKLPAVAKNAIKLPAVRLYQLEKKHAKLTINGDKNFPWLIPFKNNDLKLLKKNLKKDNESEFNIIVMPPIVHASKNLITTKKINSKYISSYINEPNPMYEIARQRYNDALIAYRRNKAELANQNYGNSSTGIILGALLSGVSRGTSAARVNEAHKRLLNTPTTIRKPIYSDYTFKVYEFEIKKKIEVPTYLIDMKDKIYYSKPILYEDSSKFRLQKRLKSSDKNYSSGTYDTDKNIGKYIVEENSVKLSDIIPRYYGKIDGSSLDSSLAFLDEKRKPKMQKITESNTNKIAISEIDQLKQSVVAILNDVNDTTGTGFYVSNNHIMTNRHVVEDLELVSLKNSRGKSFIGRVVDKHYDLDIALIKVDVSGTPVDLFSNDQLPVGQEVIAIGHPMGLEFSATKGIISAVREKKDRTIPLSEYYQYIQTDVPINPGNSGGPLFYNNQLVGMNTFKFSKEGVEGLGFAIHIKELARYLNKELNQK